jgi:hypothetical protein
MYFNHIGMMTTTSHRQVLQVDAHKIRAFSLEPADVAVE